MRTKRNWVTTVLTAAAILACIVLSVCGNVNAKDNYGQTVLMDAAWKKNFELVTRLVNDGADVNAKDELGETVLDYAFVRPDQPEIVQYLKAQGAK
ncbi:MAG: ankyrin repeat domain-containing protein [Thermodesulfobacteriota bacterium]